MDSPEDGSIVTPPLSLSLSLSLSHTHTHTLSHITHTRAHEYYFLSNSLSLTLIRSPFLRLSLDICLLEVDASVLSFVYIIVYKFRARRALTVR